MFLIALLSGTFAVPAEEQRFVARASQKISDITPELMEKHQVPGVSIALVADGRVQRTLVYGVASVKSGAPVKTNTLFEAASMSKPLFAYAALKLVEQGKLELDRPLVEYLPRPYLTNQPAHRKITARMVLTHRSGLPNWRKDGWRSKNPLQLKFEPGSKFGYSGEGFLYLQRVVERITEQPLDRFMREALLKPLRMDASSYRWETNNAVLIAAGHDAKGALKANKRRYDRPNAAYSLFTSPSEYARFLIEMMKADRSAAHSLSLDTIKEMLKPVSHDPVHDRHFGLGWAVYQGPEGVFWGHGGSNSSGFRCFCRFNPADGKGIVIMTNGIGGKALYKELLGKIDAEPGSP